MFGIGDASVDAVAERVEKSKSKCIRDTQEISAIITITIGVKIPRIPVIFSKSRKETRMINAQQMSAPIQVGI